MLLSKPKAYNLTKYSCLTESLAIMDKHDVDIETYRDYSIQNIPVPKHVKGQQKSYDYDRDNADKNVEKFMDWIKSGKQSIKIYDYDE